MESVELKLYVAGGTARADEAQASLRTLCAELLAGRARLEVIDVLAAPERARHDRVLVTPTVVAGTPERGARVFGDLSDPREVLWGLGLSS